MKKIISLALVLALCLSLLPVTVFAEEGGAIQQPIYSGGAGTQDNPWVISSVDDLMTLASTVNAGEEYKNAYFRQTADLDLTEKTWEPIGYTDSGYYFSGNYNGDNHVISNAVSAGKEDEDGQTTVGIFGCLKQGSVSNLHVRNANFIATGQNAYGHAGGLVGIALDSEITNCSVTDSTIESKRTENNNCAGGIAGYSTGSTFEKCSAENNQVKTMAYGGGFVGEVKDNSAYASYQSTFINCYSANCSVSGYTTYTQGLSLVGGFAGEMSRTNLKLNNCYVYNATLSTEGTSAYINGTGVFAGHLWGGSEIDATNCYYGKCNATENVGTATSQEEQAFSDGTLTGSLGEAFVQGVSYPVINIPITAFVLSEKDLSLSIGTKKQLTATITPSVANPKITWVSSNTDVAAVDENGLVTAVAAGTATITATIANNVKATCTVTVSNPVTHVTLDKTTLSLKRESTDTLTATVEPEDASNKNVTWASDNEAVATVDENGVVTAVSAGTANITVTTVDGKKTATCVVTVTNPSSSGSSRPRYDVTTPSKPENGSVTVDPERARSGSRVTVTVTPDSGYKLGELVVTDRDGKKLELTDKGNGQYTFTMPSGKVEVAAEFVKEVEVSPFADVATDAYYYDAVKWAVEKGITNGVSEMLFGPDQACTRAQIVTFLWRAAGSPEPKSGSSFADVAADAYYAKAVAWAVENGITKGTSETTFHPDETCTRAQGVTFLYRALGKLAAAQAGFTDVAADSYYADAVNWAAENGVTKGISETLFGPDGSCTRAQIVTFLYRAYQGK